jgi:hypothetical protein
MPTWCACCRRSASARWAWSTTRWWRGPGAIRAASRAAAEGVASPSSTRSPTTTCCAWGRRWPKMPLVTAGSGVAIGLPANFGSRRRRRPARCRPPAACAPSCRAAARSRPTRRCSAFIDARRRGLRGRSAAHRGGRGRRGRRVALGRPMLDKGPVLVYSTAEAGAVRGAGPARRRSRRRAGRAHAGRGCAGLVERGVRQLVVAGGETSGACVQALGIAQLQIGPQIDPGVPWCFARTGAARRAGLHIALKSGNFGSDDFFTKAFAVLV